MASGDMVASDEDGLQSLWLRHIPAYRVAAATTLQPFQVRAEFCRHLITDIAVFFECFVSIMAA
ncbi:MAG TPA: hypothetical protein VF749_10620 [Candidatus Acidoferrum sp.]